MTMKLGLRTNPITTELLLRDDSEEPSVVPGVDHTFSCDANGEV